MKQTNCYVLCISIYQTSYHMLNYVKNYQ